MVESVSTLSRVELTTCLYCTVPQVCTVHSTFTHLQEANFCQSYQTLTGLNM